VAAWGNAGIAELGPATELDAYLAAAQDKFAATQLLQQQLFEAQVEREEAQRLQREEAEAKARLEEQNATLLQAQAQMEAQQAEQAKARAELEAQHAELLVKHAAAQSHLELAEARAAMARKVGAQERQQAELLRLQSVVRKVPTHQAAALEAQHAEARAQLEAQEAALRAHAKEQAQMAAQLRAQEAEAKAKLEAQQAAAQARETEAKAALEAQVREERSKLARLESVVRKVQPPAAAAEVQPNHTPAAAQSSAGVPLHHPSASLAASAAVATAATAAVALPVGVGPAPHPSFVGGAAAAASSGGVGLPRSAGLAAPPDNVLTSVSLPPVTPPTAAQLAERNAKAKEGKLKWTCFLSHKRDDAAVHNTSEHAC
jgi:hypothetical protein